ncbi:MAG: transposase [Bacteroidota bacterium]
MHFNDHPIEFFTATNLNWLPVLANEYHKQILIEAWQHRVNSNQLTIYAFVIMPNHFHVIWRVHDHVDRISFQRDLMKFTARGILMFMRMHDDNMLQDLLVNKTDREYQVWERNSLSINLYTDKVFRQKLDYIHNNPLQEKWQLAKAPEEYKYSSAKFYECGKDNDFGLLTHYLEE